MLTSRSQPIMLQTAATLGEISDRWRSRRPSSFTAPVSQVAGGAHTADSEDRRWVAALGEHNPHHRKVWEWCYILQAFERHGLLTGGHRALGFGVGREPLVALLASLGVQVVATDQAASTAGVWSTSGQHAAELDALRRPMLCPDDRFNGLVSFEEADMTAIRPSLRDFDAIWSSCCFEHLGSPEAGFDFVLAAMDCLRPGGLAVHTTEFDCNDRDPLVAFGSLADGDYVCLYRAQDLRRLVHRIRRAGHKVRCNFHVSSSHPVELDIDEPPYSHGHHMRLRMGGRILTSVGLEITKRT